LFFIKFITLVFIGNNFYFNSVEIVTLTYNLRFAGFEEEWNSYFLEDVIKSFVNGQTPSRNVDSYWNGEIPWVSSGELNYNHITSTIEQITEEGKGKANLKLLPAGTFLMAITGLEAAGTRGSCAILDIEATTNQSCMALFPKEDKLTTKFLYYWYLKVGEHYGIKYTQGTKQQSYNKELLEKLPIVIPDNLKEQDKITDCLSLLHFKIELLEKKYKSYVDFKKYLMQQIFAQKLRFNFSDEWKIVKLESLIKKGKAGGTPSSTNSDYYNGDIPFLSIRDMTEQGKYILKTEKTITEEGLNNSSAWIIPKNSLLYSIYASIGLVAINRSDISTSQAIYGIILKEGVSLEYMYYYLTYFKKNIHKYIETGTQGNLNAKLLKSFEILLPSLEEQEMIVNVLSIVDEKIENSKKEIEKINEFKKGLLQQMFNNVRLVVINLIINEYICPL